VVLAEQAGSEAPEAEAVTAPPLLRASKDLVTAAPAESVAWAAAAAPAVLAAKHWVLGSMEIVGTAVRAAQVVPQASAATAMSTEAMSAAPAGSEESEVPAVSAVMAVTRRDQGMPAMAAPGVLGASEGTAAWLKASATASLLPPEEPAAGAAMAAPAASQLDQAKPAMAAPAG